MNNNCNIVGSWAILPEVFDTLAMSYKDSKEKNSEKRPKNTVVREGNTAILYIDGVLSFRDEGWKSWFGMDTYQSIGNSIDELAADPTLQNIVLSIHSPGGEVSGVADLANKIFALRDSKNIVAHTQGRACSAAYWLASACSKVYMSDNAEVGSIGVLCSYYAPEKDNGLKTVVSDLSENKVPDVNDPKGLAQIKETLNDLAAVFIENVARFRGVTAQHVLDNYGRGKVFVGQKAVDQGLADGVMTMDELLNKIKTQGGLMAEENNKAEVQAQAEAIANARAEAVAEERMRASAIREVFAGLDMDTDCQRFIDEGKTKEEAMAFAFGKAKEKLAEVGKSETALSDEQKRLIKKGMEAEASAQNGIAAGVSATAEDAQEKSFMEGFASAMKKEG